MRFRVEIILPCHPESCGPWVKCRIERWLEDRQCYTWICDTCQMAAADAEALKAALEGTPK